MPLQDCQKDGKPGLRWGESGKCYTYTPGNEGSKNRAKKNAIAQAISINKGKDL